MLAKNFADDPPSLEELPGYSVLGSGVSAIRSKIFQVLAASLFIVSAVGVYATKENREKEVAQRELDGVQSRITLLETVQTPADESLSFCRHMSQHVIGPLSELSSNNKLDQGVIDKLIKQALALLERSDANGKMLLQDIGLLLERRGQFPSALHAYQECLEHQVSNRSLLESRLAESIRLNGALVEGVYTRDDIQASLDSCQKHIQILLNKIDELSRKIANQHVATNM